MDQSLLQTILGSGPLGIVAYLLLRQLQKAADDRLQYDKDRLETDKKLVAALTFLAAKVTGKPYDGQG